MYSKITRIFQKKRTKIQLISPYLKLGVLRCFLIKRNKVVCAKCGALEKVEDAILRNVKELVLLFPDYKITSQSVYEWCMLDLNKRTFCRILKKNFTSFGNTRDTYYK
jgi:hypothetical protein